MINRPGAGGTGLRSRDDGAGDHALDVGEKNFGSRSSTSVEPKKADMLIVAQFVRDGPLAEVVEILSLPPTDASRSGISRRA